jgi:hypothetical protein
LTKTPLANLHKKGRWYNFSQCLLDGLSVRKCGEECGIHFNTAFKWRHRFLKNLNKIKPEELNGIVEIDNQCFKESFKGSKKTPKRPLKDIHVIFSKDRNGSCFDSIIFELKSTNIRSKLKDIVKKDSLICSNQIVEIEKFANKENLSIKFNNTNSREEAIRNIIHTQTVSKYYNNFIDWLDRFKGVATKYLNNYLSWHRQLDEFNYEFDPRIFLIRAKNANKYSIQPYFIT